MPNNILGDVVEELRTTVKQTVKQAVKTPIKILETGVSQISGSNQNTQDNTDEKAQAQSAKQIISQMKISDDQNKQIQINQIRQNLATMMQPKTQPKEEMPKYVTGQPGFSMEKLDKQEEEVKKAKKLPDLSEFLKGRNKGSGERFRGVSG